MCRGRGAFVLITASNILDVKDHATATLYARLEKTHLGLPLNVRTFFAELKTNSMHRRQCYVVHGSTLASSHRYADEFIDWAELLWSC